MSCGNTNYNKVSQSFEQVDVIKRLVNRFSDDMEFVDTAAGKKHIKLKTIKKSFLNRHRKSFSKRKNCKFNWFRRRTLD